MLTFQNFCGARHISRQAVLLFYFYFVFLVYLFFIIIYRWKAHLSAGCPLRPLPVSCEKLQTERARRGEAGGGREGGRIKLWRALGRYDTGHG